MSGSSCHGSQLVLAHTNRNLGRIRGASRRGPKEDINIRVRHSDSEAQYKGASRTNCGLQDLYVYAVVWAPIVEGCGRSVIEKAPCHKGPLLSTKEVNLGSAADAWFVPSAEVGAEPCICHHVYTPIHSHIRVHVCICNPIHMCIYICVNLQVCICICVCIYIYIYV